MPSNPESVDALCARVERCADAFIAQDSSWPRELPAEFWRDVRVLVATVREEQRDRDKWRALVKMWHGNATDGAVIDWITDNVEAAQ